MELSEKNKQYLSLLNDIYHISSSLGIKTYVWGGLSIDLWEGHFLREHDDLDGFTEDLTDHLDRLTECYRDLGYEVAFDGEFLMLKIKRGLVHAGFNPLKLNGKTAEWKHIGNDGSVFFPVDWLDERARKFYEAQAYTAGLFFEYALKTKVSMLNPEWQLREKDMASIAYMKSKLQEKNVSDEDIYRWFWSYNPFWFKRGYEEFFRPTVAWPIQPK